eukprot:TRINITY_DN41732_c0_g3_i1.p1 TRINITY_DN41732_c0_g3~~TRINITY_DN41732_c0_g3_i1.p1  ORF type:complete len:148 (-),score=13.52 TRINITY_DN41732_c0_g3_i1:222-665(-)
MIEAFNLANVKTFLEIFSKAGDLIRQYSVKDEKIFDEIVDPIFKELEKLVVDYFSMFRLAVEELESLERNQSVYECLRNLYRNREKLSAARIQVRETAQELAVRTHNKQLNSFFSNIEKVFRASELKDDPGQKNVQVESGNCTTGRC